MIKNWKYILAIVSSLTFTSAYSQSVKDAQRAIELERYEDATKSLSAMGGNDEATLYLGDVYLKTGKKDQATQTYAKINAGTPMGMVAAGKVALINGNTAEAEKNFEAAIKATKKKDANIYRLIGQAYLDAQAKDVTKAVAYLNAGQAVAKNKDVDAYIILGDLHMLSNNGGPAASAYDQALMIDKNSAKAHLRRGLVFTGAKNYNEAQSAYQAAIAADANYAPAYRELGENFIRVGKYDQAVENYKKYISMVGNDAEAQTKYAQILYLGKDYKGAQDVAQSVLAKDANNLKALRVSALASSETNESDKALATMEKFFSVAKPADILATDYASYGRLLSKAGKADLAQANFDKALAMDATNLELIDDAANFYLKQKQYPRAIALYKTKLAAKPSRNDRNRLAEAYLLNKQYNSSDSLFAGLIKEVPNFTTGYYKRAKIAELKEDKATATTLYQDYLKQIGTDPEKLNAPANKQGLLEANFYLGLQAYRAKDWSSAKKYWTEVKRLDPSNKDIDGNLRNIDAQMKAKK